MGQHAIQGKLAEVFEKLCITTSELPQAKLIMDFGQQNGCENRNFKTSIES